MQQAPKHVLVIGTGAMGKMAVKYLHERGITVTAADQSKDGVDNSLASVGLAGAGIESLSLDVTRPQELAALIRAKKEQAGGQQNFAVLCMTPPFLAPYVAQACINQKANFVSTNFLSPEIQAMDAAAKQAGVSITTEMGFDPGLDNMMLIKLLEENKGRPFKAIRSYGSGVPEHKNINPIGYGLSWRLRGVLDACVRDAELIESSRPKKISGLCIFDSNNVSTKLDIGGEDMLAYPNGSSKEFYHNIKALGGKTLNTGRYSMRYPEFIPFIRTMSYIGLLDDGIKLSTSELNDKTPAECVQQFLDVVPARNSAIKPLITKKLHGESAHTPNKSLSLILTQMEELGFFSKSGKLNFGDREEITARDFLEVLLTPKLQYPAGEHDKAIIRIECDDPIRNETVIAEYIDIGTEQCTAMAKGVALPATMATIHTLNHGIKAGVHTPFTIPEVSNQIYDALQETGMTVNIRTERMKQPTLSRL